MNVLGRRRLERDLTPEQVDAWRREARHEADAIRAGTEAWGTVTMAASAVSGRYVGGDAYAAEKVRRIAKRRAAYWQKRSARAGKRWAATGAVTPREWAAWVAGVEL